MKKGPLPYLDITNVYEFEIMDKIILYIEKRCRIAAWLGSVRKGLKLNNFSNFYKE